MYFKEKAPTMATNTMMSPMSLGSQFILDVDQPIANGASNAAEESIDEKDDKSSSLSELGERERHDDPEEPFDDNSEANDTEAETERLEESPQKVRKHQNVVLTPKNRTDPGHQISSTLPSLSEVLIDDGKSYCSAIDQTGITVHRSSFRCG